MIADLLAIAALAVWVGLIVARGGFWLARERDTRDQPDQPAAWPAVVAVVPARDEAEVIARIDRQLARRRIIRAPSVSLLVDDGSSDGTAAIARRLAGAGRLEVVSGRPLAPGWTGKLWALAQGVEAAGAEPRYLWLTDADIAHAPDTLRGLVGTGRGPRLGAGFADGEAALRELWPSGR